MTGCKYCHMEKGGDIPRNRKYVFDKTVLKSVGGIPTKIYANIITDEMLVGTNNDLFEFLIKIKYCPMCGRRLESV